MGKNIKLTPEMLQEMISESVKRILAEGMDEVTYATLGNAADKTDPSWYQDSDGEKYPENERGSWEEMRQTEDVFTAIKTIKNYLSKFAIDDSEYQSLYSKSFREPRYYPVVNKCLSYLSFIEKFVTRKANQHETFNNAMPGKEEEIKQKLLALAKQWNGYEGDDFMDFWNNKLNWKDLDEHFKSEGDRFVDSIEDPDVKAYIEQHL